eukprot:CAMPEP_0183366028 /NCGR_PEP_ID=MMETSP0164_2-20130417/87070_1 /TAXON_ID=221442 /ORGANISM="Coccolithus pelagicus ssp braarudi, Strain PLY182g" /LENGTH=30 /DNA_ID= /DNA_START= /DNA_END= /DNA_ORIENTATION=
MNIITVLAEIPAAAVATATGAAAMTLDAAP